MQSKMGFNGNLKMKVRHKRKSLAWLNHLLTRLFRRIQLKEK